MEITAPVAVLADIHGNLLALEAVLADIRRRGIARMVGLGDALYGPLLPAETADLLLALDIPAVAGNEDRVLLEPDADPALHSSLAHTRARLEQRHLDWLASLPPVLESGDLLFCHGTPDADDVYLRHVVTAAGALPRDAGDIAALLAGHTARVVLCGHDHLPGATRLADGRLVADPGSVGLPAYRDDAPHPHAMAAGTPHARYGILTAAQGRWSLEPVAVPYDWDEAAGIAARNGRDDWARWLRTGRAGPPA